MLKFEYFKIIIFFFISLLVVSTLVGLSFFLNKNNFKLNSKKPVECGSHSFGSGRNKIEINFYIIAVLFVVFEIEFIVLMPWLFFFKATYNQSFLIIIIFLFILVIGLLFEYCKGVFDLTKTSSTKVFFLSDKKTSWVDIFINYLTYFRLYIFEFKYFYLYPIILAKLKPYLTDPYFDYFIVDRWPRMLHSQITHAVEVAIYIRTAYESWDRKVSRIQDIYFLNNGDINEISRSIENEF